jgi:hypothetical protein
MPKYSNANPTMLRCGFADASNATNTDIERNIAEKQRHADIARQQLTSKKMKMHTLTNN